jgi:hypothetical protein
MKAALDTDFTVAELRSATGASRALLLACIERQLESVSVLDF